jgi:hypothetical protein
MVWEGSEHGVQRCGVLLPLLLLSWSTVHGTPPSIVGCIQEPLKQSNIILNYLLLFRAEILCVSAALYWQQCGTRVASRNA